MFIALNITYDIIVRTTISKNNESVGGSMNFPKDFIWGVATSSYQIEGAVNEDGRVPANWDEFSSMARRIEDGSSGEFACDHYHRYKEDVQLLKNLGVDAYRFSIAWPRIFSYDSDSKGGGVKGTVNPKGLDFYDRLIDELLANGIDPWVTLYHWDMPQTLEMKGGWRNRDVMHWIADYSAVVVEKFSDRVKHFLTLNEMPCILGGYMGWMAPGLKCSPREHLNVIHNMLLSHGNMVRAIKANAKQNVQVGCAHNGLGHFPATETPEDIAAFKKAMHCIETDPNTYGIKPGSGYILADSLIYYLDPIHFGNYPEHAFEIFKDKMPEIKDGDMEIISTPVDIQAINIYEGRPIASGSAPGVKDDGWHVVPFPIGMPQTAARWPITPQSMNHYFRFISERYKKPIYVSENGMSSADVISVDGKCHDPQRIDFTHRYLTCLKEGMDNGADVRGYFHWSLLDNFEWAHGYKERFGMVHVDYETMKRTPKDSYYWYRDLILQNK